MVKSAQKGRPVNLQHGDLGDHVAGTWEEVWFQGSDHVTKLHRADGKAHEVTMGPTAYVGTRWAEDVWPLVKSQKLSGISMGGRATRRAHEGETAVHMGDVQKRSLADMVNEVNLPFWEIMLMVDARLSGLEKRRIPHAFVASANGMCAHCGRMQDDPAHGRAIHYDPALAEQTPGMSPVGATRKWGGQFFA
jgi:hypothetical protein